MPNLPNNPMPNPKLYQVTLRNLPMGQAKALYRFLVDLHDSEPMHGGPGCSWSGMIAGTRVPDQERTVTLDPMPTHEQVTRQRDMREAAEKLADLVEYGIDVSDKFTLDQAAPDELITCTRPAATWRQVADKLGNVRIQLKRG